MTDGQKNASREFDHAEITQLIKVSQDKGWLVTFLGEGLDVYQVLRAASAARIDRVRGKFALAASSQTSSSAPGNR
jgi:hypothetical protein